MPTMPSTWAACSGSGAVMHRMTAAAEQVDDRVHDSGDEHDGEADAAGKGQSPKLGEGALRGFYR